MEIKSICLIGGGRMGRQIALNAAIYGFKASVYDLNEAVCADVKAWAEDYLAGRIKKGRMTSEQVDKIKSLFTVETDLVKACEGADCVIEAVVEREDVKRSVLRQLSDILPEDAIIATNSSVMPSSKFAEDVKNPSRLCNMHYYNPALVLKFVEVVQGPHTSEETAKACVDFCLATGKKPAWLRKEIGGFLGNYVYGGITMSSKQLVNDGVCSPYDVDNALEYGFGAKMGVFRTNDLTGIDLSLDMMRNQTAKTGVKSLMLDHYEKMVAAGRLGKGCGRGWYDYDTDPRGTIPPEFMPTNDPAANVAYKDIRSIAVVGDGELAQHLAQKAESCGFTVTLATEAQAFPGVDLVIDATGEDLQSKRALFAQLSQLTATDTILATAADTVLSSQLADVVEAPDRVCNMHFYDSALVTQFAEVVQGPHTAPATARACYEFCLKLVKTVAWLKKEVPGFLGNYIWSGLQARGKFMVQEGYCSPQDVDCAIEHGFGYKMGPFRTMDLTGIDVYFRRMQKQYEETGEKTDMYDMLEDMVNKGYLGVKSGKGFYDYN